MTAWRLRGYTTTRRDAKPRHSSLQLSDHDLDLAMRHLEQDPDIKRITVEPA